MSSTATSLSTGLVVNDLAKEYPTPAEPLRILGGVSFALAPGESVAVVGPSGSGKSTLLNIMGTLDRPTGGSVRLNDADPFALDDARLAEFRRRHVGFIFQEHHLLPQCTALENVLVAKLAGGSAGPGDVDRARSLLEGVGLGQRLTHVPGELSGGERQRVAIARAMMNSPQLLLCDEPTGNLDAKTARAVGELLTGLRRGGGTILIVVTHSIALAEMFPRRLRLEDGALVEAQLR
jgi:lipoprotein-releasing system ATP-binding protein